MKVLHLALKLEFSRNVQTLKRTRIATVGYTTCRRPYLGQSMLLFRKPNQLAAVIAYDFPGLTLRAELKHRMEDFELISRRLLASRRVVENVTPCIRKKS